MKNWLRLDYWPRPERSGMLAILTAYSLLWGWGYALVDWGNGPFSLLCYLAPWECPKQEPQEPERHYRETPIYAPNGIVVHREPCYVEWSDRTGKRHWMKDVTMDFVWTFKNPDGSIGTCEEFWKISHGQWRSVGEWRWRFVLGGPLPDYPQ